MRFGEGAATSTAAYEDAMACEMILVIAFVTAADRDQGPQCWGTVGPTPESQGHQRCQKNPRC
jgi:hypothetical protein